MKDVIFTSHCFDNVAGGDYRSQQVRLKETILAIYPDANLHFIVENEAIGKPKFQLSLYGFKVDLVKDCLAKGFKKIIFFDASITLNTKVDYWFDIIKDYGILCPVDRQKLDKVSSNKVLQYLNLTREQVSEWNLVGGSVYVFDFDNPKCVAIWNIWKDLEEKGLFGQQEDISNGKLENHRMDETCMGLAMGLTGNAPQGYDVVRYAYVNPSTQELTRYGDDYTPIVIKRHFK